MDRPKPYDSKNKAEENDLLFLCKLIAIVVFIVCVLGPPLTYFIKKWIVYWE